MKLLTFVPVFALFVTAAFALTEQSPKEEIRVDFPDVPKRCFLHLIDYNKTVLDYASIRTPFVLTVMATRLKPLVTYMKPPPDAILFRRNLDCIFQVIQLPETWGSGTVGKIMWKLSDVLPETPRLFENNVMFSIPNWHIVFLENRERVDYGLYESPKTSPMIYTRSVHRHVPIVSVMTYRLSKRELVVSGNEMILGFKVMGQLESGAVLCSECNDPKDKLLYFFNCTGTQDGKKSSNCLDQMNWTLEAASGKGRNTFWRWAINDFIKVKLPTTDGDPFEARSPFPIQETLVRFTQSGLNWSAETGGKCPTSRGSAEDSKYCHFPQGIIWMFQDAGNQRRQASTLRDFIQTKSSTLFRFITPTDIVDINNSMEIYYKPFSWRIWLYFLSLAGTMILGLSALSWLTNRKTHSLYGHVKAFFSMTFWLFTVFMEQCNEAAPVIGKFGRVARFSGAFAALWASMILIMGNAYKGFLKSEYVLTVPYRTNWSTLESLNNFTFYFPLEDKYCEGLPSGHRMSESLPYDQKLLENLCNYRIKTQVTINTGCYFYSRVYYNYFSTASIAKKKWLLQARITSRYICMRDFGSALTQNLYQQAYGDEGKELWSRVALIVSRSEFDYYWNITRNAMRRNSRLMYASNHRVDDRAFSIPNGIGFTAINQLSGWMVSRVKVLIWSGIYNLWDEWDRRRFKYEKYVEVKERDDEDFKEEFQPLSLWESDIYLVFYLLGACMKACVAGLVVELLVHSISAKIKSKRLYE